MSSVAIETAKVLQRDRAVVLAAILAISLLAWGYTLWLPGQMSIMEMPVAVPGSDGMTGMAGMNMSDAGTGNNASNGGDGAPDGMMAVAGPDFRPWGVSDFAFTFLMWAVMMVGMMTPSVAPMLLLYAAAGHKAAANGRPLAATGWFLAGYLSAWCAFSLVATAGQFMLTTLALLGPMMALASGALGALVLIGAGLYQWSPLKDRCLSQCQSPLGFLMSHGGFRSHWSGALRLGAQHGLNCVGCCWLVMVLLFVGGFMNVLWIAGLALLVLAEKIVPTGVIIPRLAGAGMIAAGSVVLFHST